MLAEALASCRLVVRNPYASGNRQFRNTVKDQNPVEDSRQTGVTYNISVTEI